MKFHDLLLAKYMNDSSAACLVVSGLLLQDKPGPFYSFLHHLVGDV